MSAAAAVAARLANPFPGLRPFHESEQHLFFGRESQVDTMIDKLTATRFLAVVGTSGSGKSSLVNCGLKPALRRGGMSSAGTSWRMAHFRPGSDPIRAMAQALVQPDGLFRMEEVEGMAVEQIVEATLRMSKVGLVDAYEQAAFDQSPNLLVIVDQFEELFRYRNLQPSDGHDHGSDEKAIAFVNLLLEAAASPHPIYVVITMRSDFLGDCAQFEGLPEAINRGQYLVPRMSRDERRSAIAGPAAVAGGEISPILLTRLVNDVGGNPDQLSILQHALNRTWAEWQRQGGASAMDLQHYEAVGTMLHALDYHAEKAFGELQGEQQKSTCEKVFQAITDKGTDARGIRRPTSASTLCAIAGVSIDELASVLAAFRKPSRSFVMPPASDAIAFDTVIDISHESLMRVWNRLKTWVEDEASSAAQYQRLADNASLHTRGAAGLMTDPELSLILDWRQKRQPNAVWGERYRPGFDSAIRFLEESRRARDAAVEAERDRQRRELRRTRIVSSGVSAILAILTFIATYEWFRAKRGERVALARQLVAESQMHLADLDRELPALLAAESMRLAASVEGDRALRVATEFQPHQERVVKYGGPFTAVAFSSDGRRLAGVNHDNTVRVYAVASGHEVAELKHDSAVKALAFSPDGERVASGGDDKTARVFDVASGQEVAHLAHEGAVNAVAFSRDGKLVASGSDDKTVRVFEATTGREIVRVRQGSAVHAVAFSSDGRRLVSGADGKPIEVVAADGKHVVRGCCKETALVFDAASGKRVTWLEHDGAVGAVAFSPDGKWVVTGSVDKAVRIFEAATGKELARLEHSGIVYAVAFSPDGELVTSGSEDSSARVWDVAAATEVARLTQGGPVHAVAFSLDGKLVYSGSTDGSARVYTVATGKRIARITQDGSVDELASSADGKWVATGSNDKRDKTVRVFETSTGKQISHLMHDDAVTAVAFSPDGKWVASGSADKTARISETGTGKEIMRLMHEKAVTTVAFSPDGKLVATGSDDKTVRVFEVATGKEITRLTHGDAVTAVAFSPDGKWVVSGSNDGTARVFDTSMGRKVASLAHSGPVYTVTFSPDGKWIATGSSDKKAHVFDVSMRKEVAQLAHDGTVRMVAFSPDSKRVASTGDKAGNTYDVRVFAVDNGRGLAEIKLSGRGELIRFTGNGRDLTVGALASVESENTVVFSRHPLDAQDLINDACSYLTRNLTPEEWNRYVGTRVEYQKVCSNLP